MTKRLIASLVVWLAVLIPRWVLAQDKGNLPEIDKIKQELSILNTEIKSELEQILVLQDAIKANALFSLPAQGRSPDIVSFTEMTNAQRQAIQRETDLNNRIQAIMERTTTNDARKQRLLDRLRTLSGVQ